MSDETRADAARRAGVDRAFLDRLIDLGIIGAEPTGGDIRRAQLAKTLDAAGIAPEGLAEVLRSGHLSLDFMDTPSYERFSTFADETFEQVSDPNRPVPGARDAHP